MNMSDHEKTVYMVTSGEYSDFSVEAIYSSRDDAVEHIGGRSECRIEEWELLDAPTPTRTPEPPQKADLYRVTIGLVSGTICPNASDYGFASAVKDEAGLCVIGKDRGGHEILVGSPVSVAHAIKVAVEKRQEWLRTREAAEAPPA